MLMKEITVCREHRTESLGIQNPSTIILTNTAQVLHPLEEFKSIFIGVIIKHFSGIQRKMLGIEIPINDLTQINESIKVLIFYEIDLIRTSLNLNSTVLVKTICETAFVF